LLKNSRAPASLHRRNGHRDVLKLQDNFTVRAVLTNFGSTGSVYPFISLALELSRNGHRPVVALSPFFSSWVEEFGLPFVPIGPDLKKIQYAINEAMLDLPETEEPIREMFAPLMPALPRMFDELGEACRNADVLISGPWQPASLMIHELTGIPFVTIQNSHFGGGGTPAFQRASASLINPFRTRYGLSPVRDPLTGDANSPQLVLYNMSRHVRPPLPDWPPHYSMPGYMLLEDGDWRPPRELEEFIEQEPPVVITFGSMTHGDPEAIVGTIIEAVEMYGGSAILQKGWGSLAGSRVPPQLRIIDFIPHDWLFPRARLIVHHGGAGTAASVFNSGVPSVFVPHAFDHPLWAELALGLGCAGPPIPFPELSGKHLGEAIIRTLDDPGYAKRAAVLGEKIRAEQGLRKARLLIEQLVSRAGVRDLDELSAVRENVSGDKQEKLARRRSYLEKQRARKTLNNRHDLSPEF
jgi:sterol 3beta-glucosyltransferase